MAKLVLLAIVLCLISKVLLKRWPWEMLGTGDGEAVRNARALLGVGKSASYAEVVEAHRRLIARVHPDRGGTSEQVHEANAARDLLLARCKKTGLE